VSLIAFASAKGSPGVSTLAAGLARVWPRRTLVADLDPIGGDLGLLLRDVDGEPLRTDRGLLSLGAAVRGGASADLDHHVQPTEDGLSVLVGVSRPSQVQALGPAWPHVAITLARSEADVLADCGRVHPGAATMPVLERADAVVFVLRSDVPSVAHLRERLQGLHDPLRLGAIDGVPVGFVVVGDPKQQRAAEDIERLLASAGLTATSLGVVAHDPRTVRILHSEDGRAVRRSLLVRSLHDLTGRIEGLVESRARGYQSI